MTTIEIARQRLQARLHTAQVEADARVAEARRAAEQEVRTRQKAANTMVRNATFENVYYIFNNNIFKVNSDVFQSESLVDVNFESSMANFQRERLEKVNQINGHISAISSIHVTLGALEAQIAQKNAELSALRPLGFFMQPQIQELERVLRSLIQERDQLRRQIEEQHKEIKRLERELASQRPPRPDNLLGSNAAVSDMIVHLERNIMIWGRWAAPFSVHSLDLSTRRATALYDRDLPVTSVAIDDSDADSDNHVLYWIEGNEVIMRGNLNGDESSVSEFLNIKASDKGGLWQLDIDTQNNMLYWTNDISIWRVPISDAPAGNSQMVISPSESSFPIDLAVDGQNGFLYWIDQDHKMVRRSTLAGEEISDICPVNQPSRGLVVDAQAELLYWSDKTGNGHRLVRADLDQITFDPENKEHPSSVELEYIIGVPGLDGLVLVSRLEAERAARKRAYNELQRKREAADKAKAEAEAEKARRLAEARRRKEEAIRLERERLAAAEQDALRKKEAARIRKAAAEVEQNIKRIAAANGKADKIALARNDAADIVQLAQNQGDALVAEANRVLNEAERELRKVERMFTDLINNPPTPLEALNMLGRLF